MAKNESKVKDFSDIQEGWEEEATFLEFPPYWSPAEGKSFQGKVIARDETGDFPRYVIEATAPAECAKGAGDDSEPVMVEPGQKFTVSEYASLPLSLCFGLEIKATSVERSAKKTKAGFNPWQWKLVLPTKDRKILQARKAEAENMFPEAKKTEELIS
jgi:hypothetical protein